MKDCDKLISTPPMSQKLYHIWDTLSMLILLYTKRQVLFILLKIINGPQYIQKLGQNKIFLNELSNRCKLYIFIV